MEDFIIDNFTSLDYDEARKLWAESEGISLGSVDTKEKIEAFLHRNPCLSFVARRDREMAGTVLCGHDGRRGFIYHLAVRERYRRKGVGRILVQSCLHALQKQGIEKCHIFVLNNNALGRDFWVRLGWKERQDITLMSKNINRDQVIDHE